MSAISRRSCGLCALDLSHDDRHATETGVLRRAPAAFAGDDLVGLADAPHDDRLDHAVRPDRLRELLEPRVVNAKARLVIVRPEAIDVQLGDSRLRFRGVRDQRAQTFAERAPFGVGHCTCPASR